MGDRSRGRVAGRARRRADGGAEPAPAAQQAVPADKVGPPLHAKQPPVANIKRDETTGAAPKELKPSHGDDAVNPGKLEKDTPSR